MSPRRRDEADLVVLELIRLTSAAEWDRRRAAKALLAKRYSAPALRLAQRRALRARARSVSRVADRAAEALDEALALLGGAAPDRDQGLVDAHASTRPAALPG